MSQLKTQNLQTAMGDRFVLDRELGRGSTGVVYQARDVRLGRQLAIKVLSPNVAMWAGSDGFEREIRYAARLQHPNILPLIETGYAGKLPYYVMPYVKGGSLRERLDDQTRLDVEEAMRVTHDIGSALECAHDNRIVHLDLKPENILMSHGIAVLADFGISHLMRRDEFNWRKTAGSGSGTPLYMSPEQATGEGLDERSDVYSLACVLHEMLVGSPPFEGDSIHTILARRLTESVTLVSEVRRDVPRDFARAVAKALSIDPASRFGSVRAFVDALDQALARATEPRKAPTAARPSLMSAISSLWRRTPAAAHLTGEHLLTGEH